MSRRAAAFAAFTFDLTDSAVPAREIQILPAGEFRARDGRPKDVPAWRLDARGAARLIERLHARRNPIVVDYEHQTLHAEKNGQPAPAAAWLRRFEWREGSGLWAVDVEWTERAASMIAAKEYRFVSPVIRYSKDTGEVVDLLHVALTNDPAIDGMTDVAGRAAARYLSQLDMEDDMKALNALLAALGLQPVETEEQALAAARAYAEQVKAKDEKIEQLTAQVGKQDAELAALKASGGEPDPQRFVPIAVVQELQTQVAALAAKQTEREVDEIVSMALEDGRLLPAMEDWARKLGQQDIAALRAYVEKAPAIAALTGTQTAGKPPVEHKTGLTDAELAVCKHLGIDPEDYKKANAGATAAA